MKPSTRSSFPHCLICSVVCDAAEEPGAVPLLEGGMEGAVQCPSLERNLFQFFILRQLLDVPSKWCEETLEAVDENGGPETWFRICPGCVAKWVAKAWRTYQRILDLESQLRGIKEGIRESMLGNLMKKRGQKFQQPATGTKGRGVEHKIKRLIFSEYYMDKDLKMGTEEALDDNPGDFQELDVDMPLLEDASYSPIWGANVEYPLPVIKVDPEQYLVKAEDEDEEFQADPAYANANYVDDGDDDDDYQVPRKRKRQQRGRKAGEGLWRKRKRRIRTKVKGNRPEESEGLEASSSSSPIYWRYCKLCSQAKFTDPQELESHLAAHEESKRTGGMYDCKICKFPAMDSAELEVHNNHRHTNKRETKKYKCEQPECDFVSLTWKVLKEHFLKEHPDIPEEQVDAFKLQCNVCSRDFPTLKSMMVHKKIEHPELFGVQKEAISCEHCSQVFSSGILLKYHINSTHMRVTKFICDTCGKGFRFLTRLDRHKLIHGKGNRKYVCHVCGIDYKYDSQLDQHILKFHPEVSKKLGDSDATSSAPDVKREELSCRYCNMTTPYKPVMMRHMEIHKAEMGNKCDLCGKCYTTDQGLKRHKRLNHPTTNEAVNCPHCNKVFPNVEYMKTHTSKYCRVKKLKEGEQQQQEPFQPQPQENFLENDNTITKTETIQIIVSDPLN